MSYEAWGEPDECPPLPEGWWDEDQVQEAQEKIERLTVDLTASRREVDAWKTRAAELEQDLIPFKGSHLKGCHVTGQQPLEVTQLFYSNNLGVACFLDNYTILPNEMYQSEKEQALADLTASRREIEELQRLIKNLAPTGKYNGLDIEQWFQRAEQAEQQLTACRQERDAEMEGILKLRKECGAKNSECFPDFVRRLHKELAASRREVERLREKLTQIASEEEEMVRLQADCIASQGLMMHFRNELMASRQECEGLRRRLAEAGVEGSPPNGGQGTIPMLAQRAQSAEQQLAAARQAIEDWRKSTNKTNPDDCAAGIAELYGNWQKEKHRAESAEQQLAELKVGYAVAVEAAVKAAKDSINDEEDKTPLEYIANSAEAAIRAALASTPQSIQDILDVLEAARAWVENDPAVEFLSDRDSHCSLIEAVRKMEDKG